MTSPEPGDRPRLLPLALCRLWLVLAVCMPAGGLASTENESQAWLLTYGPGDIYWQRFGHNAIWIRDPRLGLDHTFNFGFFDFNQENFLGNFMLGRLNYFAAARPAELEIAEYIDDNRAVRAQRLDLGPQQMARLTGHLLNQVHENNREYLYDYYRHNCSTRVRDALDIALDGGLGRRLAPQATALNYRDHTRRLTEMDYWLYLGLQAGLGSPIDKPISRWEETFIPEELARAVEDIMNPGTGRPLLSEDVMLYESTLPPPPEEPHSVWWRYLPLALALLVMAFGARLAWPRLESRHLATYWLVVSGLAGAVLAFLWAFTDHWASALNLNLLLFNPLWLLVALVPGLRRPGAWLIAICGVLAALAPWLPPAQYNVEVVALALPLNLAAAWVLGRGN